MSNNTSNKIAVSVIIPITTTETYLARCLDSVLSQTLHNIEVILVDISSDVPSSLCAKYADQDSRIKVLNKNGCGYGAAFNAGLAEASGEYIAFVDHSDWLENDMYEVLYRIASDQYIDVAHCLKYSNREGKEPKVSNPFNPKDNLPHVGFKSDYKFYVPMLLFYSEDIYSTIYRKEFLNEHEIRFSETQGSNAQNLGFTFLVFCHLGSFYIYEKPLYHLNPDRSYFNDKSFQTAISSVPEYYHIKRLIEQRDLMDRYIGKRYLHIGMAKIFRHIRHRFYVHSKSVKQKLEFLRAVEPFLKEYYPLKNDSMFLSYTEKRLYKRFIRHPVKAAITYNAKKKAIQLGKKVFTDISFNNRKKQLRIFGLRLFFYKKSIDYLSFSLIHIPIIRKKTVQIDSESDTETKVYFLNFPILKKNVINNFISKEPKITDPYQYAFKYRQASVGISRYHDKLFTQFKCSCRENNLVIFGPYADLDSDLSRYAKNNKNILCNGSIEHFKLIEPDFIFADTYSKYDKSYDFINSIQSSPVFLREVSSDINKENLHFFYSENRRIEDFEYIKDDIEHFRLAYFGSIVHSAIHFAIYTEPKSIILIGCEDTVKAEDSDEMIISGYRKLKSLRDCFYPGISITSIDSELLNEIFQSA